MFTVNVTAKSDIGFLDYEDRINEDFVHCKIFETEIGQVIFGVVADGAGSSNHQFIPSRLAAIQIEEAIERICNENPQAFVDYPQVFLKEAMVSASYTLGAFRMADERNFNGFATSLSCVVIFDNKFAFAHTGNTRINLFRLSKKEENKYVIKQLTTDQTRGMDEVNAGKMSFAEYHLHPSRLEVTGGLGTSTNPTVQTLQLFPLRANDLILIISDGIHNALRPEVILELILSAKNFNESVDTLIAAAKSEKYQDNMAALLIWAQPEITGSEESNK